MQGGHTPTDLEKSGNLQVPGKVREFTSTWESQGIYKYLGKSGNLQVPGKVREFTSTWESQGIYKYLGKSGNLQVPGKVKEFTSTWENQGILLCVTDGWLSTLYAVEKQPSNRRLTVKI